MKIILLIGLFVFFVLIGIFIYNFYLVRYHLYFDLEFMCKYLKNNISFFKNDIASIISSIKNKLHNSTIKIVLSNSEKLNFLKNDILIISKFISSLGCGDVDYELNNLNYYEDYFCTLKNECKDDVKNKGLLYMKLVIILGLAFVIILI